MKKLVMAGKTKRVKEEPSGATSNPSTFVGEMDKSVTINLTEDQKELLVKASVKVGLPLSAFIRSKAMEAANVMLIAQEL